MDKWKKGTAVAAFVAAVLTGLTQTTQLYDWWMDRSTEKTPQNTVQSHPSSSPQEIGATPVTSEDANSSTAKKTPDAELISQDTNETTGRPTAESEPEPDKTTVDNRELHDSEADEMPRAANASLPPPVAPNNFDFGATETASLDMEVVRLQEKLVHFPCGSQSSLMFTVARFGAGPDQGIYLSQPVQTGRLNPGDKIELGSDCVLKLARTGKSSTFFAEFLIERD